MHAVEMEKQLDVLDTPVLLSVLLCSCPDFHHKRFTVKGHSRDFRGVSSIPAPHARDPRRPAGPRWLLDALKSRRVALHHPPFVQSSCAQTHGRLRWCSCYKYECMQCRSDSCVLDSSSAPPSAHAPYWTEGHVTKIPLLTVNFWFPGVFQSLCIISRFNDVLGSCW